MKAGVVIVTYNRLDKLKKCLDAYEKQSFLPEYLIVIDNCSTDGTEGFLEKWKDKETRFRKIVIRMKKNLGGAGGFSEGIRRALEIYCEAPLKNSQASCDFFLWIGDDDAYPRHDCLQKVAEYYDGLPADQKSKIAALCGKVTDNQGISKLHRRRIQRVSFQIKEVPLREEEYLQEAVLTDIFSFVGTCIRMDIIREAGLPHADYFIFYDDSEYSLRVGKRGQILCIPEAEIMHDSLENTIVSYSWKNYYMFRNKMYTYRQYFSRFACFADRVKMMYMIWKFYNTPETWKQYKKAVKDVKTGKLGVREEYLPDSVVF